MTIEETGYKKFKFEHLIFSDDNEDGITVVKQDELYYEEDIINGTKIIEEDNEVSYSKAYGYKNEYGVFVEIGDENDEFSLIYVENENDEICKQEYKKYLIGLRKLKLENYLN